MIPKKIHQIFFEISKPFAELPTYVESSRLMEELHSDWEYKLWLREDCEELLQSKFPHLVDFYNSMRYDIQRIDLMKILILHSEGGIYSDLDIFPIKPFDGLLSKKLLLHSVSHLYRDTKDYVTNDFMASVPAFKFWDIVLAEMQENYKEKSSVGVYDSWKGRFVLQTTGPRFLSRMVKKVIPRYRPFHICYTKYRNKRWEKENRNDYYIENFFTGEWLNKQ